MEQWKDICFTENGVLYDYTGLYAVSSEGNVKSLNYNGTEKEKILKPVKRKGGYKIIGLCKDGKRKQFLIHRLVLHVFNPEGYFEGADVDHINTDRSDNRFENLRWCTRKENINNQKTIENMKKRYNSQLLLDDCLQFYDVEELAELMNNMYESNPFLTIEDILFNLKKNKKL